MGRLNMIFLGIVAILVTSGCVQKTPDENKIITAHLDNQFILKINQTGFIETDGLKIKFINVTEDSRCPADVQCIWAGQATIMVNILKNDEYLGDFSLTAGAAHNDSAVKNFDGYSLKLVKVEPYPITTGRIDFSDYTVTLVVSET